MKSTLYTLIGLMIVLVLASCSDKPARPASVVTPGQVNAANARAAADANTTAITPPAANTPEPAQNAAGVWHYTCSSGCAGGAGSAVACATCGNTLVHNTTYHDTPAASPATSIGAAAAGAAGATLPTPITPPVQQTPEPAQNAAGVWHYTCSSGCAGGAGSAIACATCGNTLVHNQGYH